MTVLGSIVWIIGAMIAVALAWLVVFATLVAAVRVGIGLALDGADTRAQLIDCLVEAVRRLRDGPVPGPPADSSPLARLRAERLRAGFSKHESS